MKTTSDVAFNPNPPPRYTGTGGTTIVGTATGLIDYLSPTGANPAPTVVVTGQLSPSTPLSWIGDGIATIDFAQTSPTAAYLAQVLNANDGVEVGIQYGTFGGPSGITFNPTGGHEMTLQSIDFNAASGTGTIGFIDPDGTVAYALDGTVSLDDGFLYVTYKLDNGQTVFGRILDDTVESISIPDSAMTSSLLGMSLLGLCVFRRGRCPGKFA
jgi:hypothetical protein